MQDTIIRGFYDKILSDVVGEKWYVLVKGKVIPLQARCGPEGG